jgi:hypothetical protein
VFEQFVKRPFHLAQYRNGPYAEERSRFMERLVQQGRCVGRLKALNWLLEVAKRVDLSGDRSYTANALMSVAEHWQRTRGSRSNSVKAESQSWTSCSLRQVGCDPWTASSRKKRNCLTGNSWESSSRFSEKKEALRMPRSAGTNTPSNPSFPG